MLDDQLDHPDEGFWHDGEWVSWNWINEQLFLQERREEFPAAAAWLRRSERFGAPEWADPSEGWIAEPTIYS